MADFDKLNFGTAGVPLSTEKRSILNGIAHVRELGLGAMELEFVRSVNVNEELAVKVKAQKEEHDVTLTCHGQYFINLNSLEQAKVEASVQRVLNAARAAWNSGAFSMTFHAAFYQQVDPAKVYSNVRERLKEIVKTLQDECNSIWVRPETTGKVSQFSGLDDLLKISQEVEQVMPCVDFAHLHARTGGKENTLEEFRASLEKVENALGREGLDNMHMHVSGINYTEKGERNHLMLEESDLNFKDLMKALKEFKVKGALICESPDMEKDALLLQKTYEKVKL